MLYYSLLVIGLPEVYKMHTSHLQMSEFCVNLKKRDNVRKKIRITERETIVDGGAVREKKCELFNEI